MARVEGRDLTCVDPRDALTYLGECLSLTLLFGRARKTHDFFPVRPSIVYDRASGRMTLGNGDYRVTPNGIANVPRSLVPPAGSVKAKPSADARAGARRSYRITHWGSAGEFVERPMLCVDPRDRLHLLAEVVAISYLATKKGDPPNSKYVHVFEILRPYLAYDRASGRATFAGGDYRVTVRGIVG